MTDDKLRRLKWKVVKHRGRVLKFSHTHQKKKKKKKIQVYNHTILQLLSLKFTWLPYESIVALYMLNP